MGDILTPVAHVHGAMALSPDGSQLAFVGKSGPSFIRPIDQLEAVVLQIGAAKQWGTKLFFFKPPIYGPAGDISGLRMC